MQFIDQSVIKNGDVGSDLSPIKKAQKQKVIPASIPTDAVEQISKSDLDYEDNNVLLSSLKAPENEEEQKWRKEFNVNVQKKAY